MDENVNIELPAEVLDMIAQSLGMLGKYIANDRDIEASEKAEGLSSIAMMYAMLVSAANEAGADIEGVRALMTEEQLEELERDVEMLDDCDDCDEDTCPSNPNFEKEEDEEMSEEELARKAGNWVIDDLFAEEENEEESEEE